MWTLYRLRRISGGLAFAALVVAIGSAGGAGPARAQVMEKPGARWLVPPASSWWLNLRTTGYTFQSQNVAEPKLDRFGAYQNFDGAVSGLANGKLSFRAFGRVADDVYLEQKTTDRGRLYAAQLEARPSSQLTARLGRQFVQEGSTGLTLDGMWLSFRPDRKWDARIWGGASAPFDRTFAMGKLDEDPAVGLRVTATPRRELRLSGSWAYRERDGVVAARPVGLEGSLSHMGGLLTGVRLVGRASYDLERDGWDREEALLDWRLRPQWPTVALQWVDRRPAIDAASYFSRFANIERARIGRATVRYEHRTGFGFETEYLGAFVDRNTSTRIGGAFLSPIGRLGYSARIGDSGEESTWYGDAYGRPASWLRIGGGATFATYALLQDAPDSEDRELKTVYARVRATPRPGLGMTLELQRLESQAFSHDTRLLLGMDLTMGRGIGRFGLDRGGWFK